MSNGNQPFPVAGGSYSYSQRNTLLDQTDFQFQDQFNYSMSPLNSPSNAFSTMYMNPSIATGMKPIGERSSLGDIAVSQAEPMPSFGEYGTNSQSSVSSHQSGRQGMYPANEGASNYPSNLLMSPVQHQPVSPPFNSVSLPQQTQYSMPMSYSTRYSQFDNPPSGTTSRRKSNTIPSNLYSFSDPLSNPESSFPEYFNPNMEDFGPSNDSWDHSLNQFQSVSATPASEKSSERAKWVPPIPPHRSSKEILSIVKQAKSQRHSIIRKQPSEPPNQMKETEKQVSSDWKIKSELVGRCEVERSVVRSANPGDRLQAMCPRCFALISRSPGTRSLLCAAASHPAILLAAPKDRADPGHNPGQSRRSLPAVLRRVRRAVLPLQRGPFPT